MAVLSSSSNGLGEGCVHSQKWKYPDVTVLILGKIGSQRSENLMDLSMLLTEKPSREPQLAMGYPELDCLSQRTRENYFEAILYNFACVGGGGFCFGFWSQLHCEPECQ